MLYLCLILFSVTKALLCLILCTFGVFLKDELSPTLVSKYPPTTRSPQMYCTAGNLYVCLSVHKCWAVFLL